MSNYFNDLFIKGNEYIYYAYICIIILMIIVICFLGYKELKKK